MRTRRHAHVREGVERVPERAELLRGVPAETPGLRLMQESVRPRAQVAPGTRSRPRPPRAGSTGGSAAGESGASRPGGEAPGAPLNRRVGGGREGTRGRGIGRPGLPI
jgi:hypothetical protein